MDIYQHDDSFRRKGFEIIAGIDEAGRGPVAGPVVAAAVVLPPDLRIEGLRDSKKIPEQERTHLFWDVLSFSLDVGVGIVDHDEIDRINILQATRLAMKKAVDDLRSAPDALIIDAVTLPSVKVKQFSIIKGDSKSAAVAAASIIAKYVRDMVMLHYHSLYPEYNFKKHKGYCTEEHLHLIQLHGPCRIHRKSFKRVMELVLPF
ncbi:MAG: ribonuclease HII [Nitrospirota bacterium]|nr:ribonuclease HII [Nitrospirota bacterium]